MKTKRITEEERQIYYLLATKEILELFAEQELGSRCEINIPAVLGYIKSIKFVNDCWGLNTKEEIYQLVTDDILSGYPIWQLLDMPEWTRNMVEREFTLSQEEKRKQLIKKYKCYTCKYFEEHETSLGIFRECKRPRDKHDGWLHRRGYFDPVKKCKYYVSDIYDGKIGENDGDK